MVASIICRGYYITRIYLRLRDLKSALRRMNDRTSRSAWMSRSRRMFKDLFDGMNELSESMRSMLRNRPHCGPARFRQRDDVQRVAETTMTAQDTANTVSQLARGSEEQVHAIVQRRNGQRDRG